MEVVCCLGSKVEIEGMEGGEEKLATVMEELLQETVVVNQNVVGHLCVCVCVCVCAQEVDSDVLNTFLVLDPNQLQWNAHAFMQFEHGANKSILNQPFILSSGLIISPCVYVCMFVCTYVCMYVHHS